MNNPLVSVVVPVYNVEKYLDRCIDSIVNQTYKNLEIILVDDGSPDKCPQMCDQWAEKDSRIKVIHKENAGAGMARNIGIENATGEYIQFIDSDDYIDLKTIQKCVASFQKTQADAVMFGRFHVFSDGKIEKLPVITNEYFFSGKQVIDNILPGLFIYEKGIGISSWCKMFKLQRIKLNNIRYKSEREVLSEDALFHLELFDYLNSVLIIPENLYYYFTNESSISRGYRKDLQTLNNKFLEECLVLCDKYGYKDKIINSIYARYHIYAFAGMKQIKLSNLSKEQKKMLVYNFFNDEMLQESITFESLKFKSIPLKVFYICIKFRLYWICRLLLKFAN